VGGEAVVTAEGDGEAAEDQGFDDALAYVLGVDGLVNGGPVYTARQREENGTGDPAAY
jgi:hypothetical protein